MRFCECCGNQLNEDASFCHKCGNSVGNNVAANINNYGTNNVANTNSASQFCCPYCGNRSLQSTTSVSSSTTGKDYSAGKGCLGFLVFGPLGLLCGACGSGKQTKITNRTYWLCPRCGKRFKQTDELRQEIDALRTHAFLGMSIAGIVLGVIVAVLLAGLITFDMQYVIGTGVGIFVVFALAGLLVQLVKNAQRKALEEELREMESNMNRFANE